MTIDQNRLIQLYNSRSDLQQVYNPDGSKRDPNNPSPTTLTDWAMTFGLKEDPTLDPRYSTLSKYFTPEQIKLMPEDIKTGLAAFGEVQQKNYETGKAIVDINSQTWFDAMSAAASDPSIVNKYGDELKLATDSIGTTLKALSTGYTQEQAATLRNQELERQHLAENEAKAGRAYSGFRKQAEEKLKQDQGDIITSSKRQLEQNLQTVVKPFEQRFGTKALDQLNPPTIEGEKYNPVGGIVGTVDASKEADTKALATKFYNATQTP